MIPVSKPFLPDRELLDSYIDKIYESNYLTNRGPLLASLEERLAGYLDIDPERLILVANGSLALQVAYKALGLTGEVITTPYSFVATASTLKWEGLDPVFADIDPVTWNISPEEIERSIGPKTSAILPVHVYGNPCDVDKIKEIAERHNLKVIYDASHCFGTQLGARSVLESGDISTLSLHATKLFHTAEGGAIVAKSKALADKIRKMINFGLSSPYSVSEIGTNAKLSELHAAIGLANLDVFQHVLSKRGEIWRSYVNELQDCCQLQKWNKDSVPNLAYLPILMKSEQEVLLVLDRLEKEDVFARRYFYPSLDDVGVISTSKDYVMPNSKMVSSRILCLPLHASMSKEDSRMIAKIVREVRGQ